MLTLGGLQQMHAQSIGNKTYAVTMSDKGCVVNGFNTFQGLTDEEIFANALMWTITNICPSMLEGIQEVNVPNKCFSFNLSLPLSQETKQKNSFQCNVKMQVADGRLVFLINHITVESPLLMISSKTTAFEKLQPDKKESHKNIINEFEEQESATICSIFDFVNTNKLSPITHWEEIANGKLTKGMNQDECMLAFGKPSSIYESNGEVQWMYTSFFYIFFKDGEVSSFIK